MSHSPTTSKLVRDPDETDHYMGNPNAETIIVEYGDFQCPHCGQLHQIVRQLIAEESNNIKFVFRHFPLSTLHPQAQLAAEATEAAGEQGKFFEMAKKLFENQNHLSIEDLVQYAIDLKLDVDEFRTALETRKYEQKVKDGFLEGVKSGVNGTPTLFINGHRYDGAWDIRAIREQIQQPFGVRIQTLASRFNQLAISGGILLFAFTVIALIWANSPLRESYFQIWESEFLLEIGSFHIEEHIEGMINDGLMAIFFFVVGLEIKRELLMGELASFRKALLPIFAAIGGMLIPALIYLLFTFQDPELSVGWGIPMATDIAFLLVILSFLDSRVPPSLRIFFSALAIVDDLGAILVISIVYTEQIYFNYLLAGFVVLAILVLLNRLQVNAILPYMILGLILWYFFLESGVHSTIAGVLLAFTIPTHHPPDTAALIAQCSTLQYTYEAIPTSDQGRKEAVVSTLESISDRLNSPAQRLEHEVQPWTTYLILPLFALANAGLYIGEIETSLIVNPVTLGIIFGLVIGKPLGIMIFAGFAIKVGWAELPAQVTWKALFSVSCLTGIGFTISLFISGIAFSTPSIVDQAKFGVLLASILAGVIGMVLSIVLIPPMSGSKSGYYKQIM